MKSLLNKILGKDKEIIKQTPKKEELEILLEDEFFNTRYNYAEFGRKADKETIDSMRTGIQYKSGREKGNYQIMIETFPKGSVTVNTGKKEEVTSEDSPNGSLKIKITNPGHEIKYDLVLRFLDEFPAQHMYFLNGEYVFTRRVTPSMGASKPKDIIENPTGSDAYDNCNFICIESNKLKLARPLIKEMEKEIGRKIVNERYYSHLPNKEVSDLEITDAYKYIRTTLYW